MSAHDDKVRPFRCTLDLIMLFRSYYVKLSGTQKHQLCHIIFVCLKKSQDSCDQQDIQGEMLVNTFIFKTWNVKKVTISNTKFSSRDISKDFNSATKICDLSFTSVQQHPTVIRPATPVWVIPYDTFPMTEPFKICFEIIIRNNHLIIHVHGHSESKDIFISTLRRSRRSHVLRPRFSNYNDTLRSVQPKIVRVR